jgi:uncharacterized protein
MRWGSKVLVVMCLLDQGMLARAASFDCRNAVQPQEKAICINADLDKADEEMTAAYRAALGQVSTAAATAMRDDQRMWLRWLGTVCEADKSADAKKLAGCMIGPYRERVEELEKAMDRQGDRVFYTRAVYLSARVKDDASAGASASFSGFGTVTANWLQVDSLDAGWIAWNVAMARWAREMVGDDDPHMPWSDKLVVGADENILTTLERLTPKMVSVEVEDDSMGHGAAHPNESWRHIHWLRAERRELRAGDVFKEGTPWKSVLARRCWTFILHELGTEGLLIAGPMAKELVAAVESPQNWSFDEEGLTISFPEYSVSPRAFPAPDVRVPWAVLRPYLALASPVGR